MEIFDIYLTVHLLGVIIGAGSAFFGDAVFVLSHEDKHISRDERNVMHLSTKIVWFGLLLMVVSGAGLFALDPARYLASASFLAKMSIVVIIIANGLVFTFIHHKEIKRRSHKKARGEDPNNFLPVSGVLSTVSWLTVVLLALLKPAYSYLPLMTGYVFFLAAAFFIAQLVLKRILKKAEVPLLKRAFWISLVCAIILFILSRA